MAKQDFDDVWVPRIGSEAANDLRRNGYLTLALSPVIIALVILAGIEFGNHSSVQLSIGVVAIVAAIALAALWQKSRLRLTKSISVWFGAKLRWFELPRMTAKQFDSWRQDRDLTRPKN